MEKLLYDFEEIKNHWGNRWNNDEADRITKGMLDNIFPNGNESKIAVLIESVDEGHISKTRLEIFDSYINALSTINSFEYNTHVEVKVYEVNRHAYAHLMYKIYDCMDYRRLAQVKAEKYSPAIVRYFFDTSCTIVESYYEIQDKEKNMEKKVNDLLEEYFNIDISTRSLIKLVDMIAGEFAMSEMDLVKMYITKATDAGFTKMFWDEYKFYCL